MLPPYLAYHFGLDTPFSGFSMVPAMAVDSISMMVHEAGHMSIGWLFGYPSVFAFDNSISLGMTVFRERSYLFLGLIWAALTTGILRLRRLNLRRQMHLLAGLLLLHIFIALSPAYRILMLYMGHGMEVIAAYACIVAALYCRGKMHDLWRILLMAAGIYVLLENILMCLELIFVHLPRGFGTMKQGNYVSDFVRLQRLTGLGVPQCAVPLLLYTLLFLCAAFLKVLVADRAGKESRG